jgi:hypothetical protein
MVSGDLVGHNQKHGISALGLLAEAQARHGATQSDHLTGEVEVDETYVGSVEPGGVTQALEEQGLGSDCSPRRWRGDRAHSAGPRPGRIVPQPPVLHRVASLLKRWLLGIHQGGMSRDHLEYYLDEFTFRFNRRTLRHRGKLFYRLLQQAVSVEPVPFSRFVAPCGHHG